MTRGIILFGHGSRDPAWREPMEDIARRIAAKAPDTLVRCAYLELNEPDFAGCVDALAALGADRVAVLPMFVGMGRHAREDLPLLVQAARRKHPGIAIEQHASLGEDTRVLDLVARIALE